METYFEDVYTDTQFSLSLFQDFYKNFTKSTEVCHQDFDKKLDDIIILCKSSFSKDECLEALAVAGVTGDECFNNGQRFEDKNEWWNGGIISAIHIALPIAFSVFLWIMIMIDSWKKSTRVSSMPSLSNFCKTLCSSKLYENCFFNLLKLPLPPLTKLRKLICVIKLFNIKTTHPKDDKEKTEKENLEIKYKDELESHDNIVNTSMVVEASMESGFQFWFQTVYILPTIILSFIKIGGNAEWADLFNWRMFSILMSFASFAWTFYTIRLL